MLKTLQLKDIFVGKTDAKNEFIENSLDEQTKFIDSYLIPENISIDDFENGNKFYITGLKGTGKTALLRYLELSFNKESNSSFILFKSEFSEDDKANFSKAASTFLTEKNENNEIEEDFLNVWEWFLHRHLVKYSLENKTLFFKDDKDWQKYVKCISAPKLGDESSGITKLIPKLKRGNVEIEGDFEFIKSKLGIEFDWENEKDKLVKFSSIVKQANELYKKLTPLDNKMYIFIDELELALGKTKQFQKDIKLIRDLIVAINNLNLISRKLKFPIYFITAIRSEVLTSIQSSGKEINKPILDFGISLKWQQSGGSSKTHPLIKIINKKIQSAERSIGIQKVSTDEEIWKKYFPDKINTIPSPEYILHRTWYRPRDIIRLLSIGQQQFPNETSFSHVVFDAIVKEYSTQSWIEHAEELRAILSEQEIDGVKKLLTSIKCPFTFLEFRKICDEKINLYSDVETLFKKHKPADILSILYRIGLIGNTGQKVRYSFRGDDELVLENNMKIHDPLWNYLSIEARRI
ncbi:hypothetical protein HX096_16120 [Empedobacter falsenii]|uniref:P-loop ATPase, Sll1717 family n=1 Tax=Empedobacter falsenii TaxID=343874 RepID=UPI00257632EF|nr:hypothetical protein [Empedobacter falsenii]MDM1549381.1 hypothetical protein [Empedobacter falsenii]